MSPLVGSMAIPLPLASNAPVTELPTKGLGWQPDGAEAALLVPVIGSPAECKQGISTRFKLCDSVGVAVGDIKIAAFRFDGNPFGLLQYSGFDAFFAEARVGAGGGGAKGEGNQ